MVFLSARFELTFKLVFGPVLAVNRVTLLEVSLLMIVGCDWYWLIFINSLELESS